MQTKKYFCTHQGWDWTFYDQKTGQKLIHISQAIKPQKHVKIRANANPYDEQWAEYFKTRDKNIKLKRMYGLRFKVDHKQQGVCTCCKQPLNMKQAIDLHHKEGNKANNKIDNLVLLHLNCHRQVHHSGLNIQLEPHSLFGRMFAMLEPYAAPSHVRFLGGKGIVRFLTYPTKGLTGLFFV